MAADSCEVLKLFGDAIMGLLNENEKLRIAP
jgi:hypothetical protein